MTLELSAALIDLEKAAEADKMVQDLLEDYDRMASVRRKQQSVLFVPLFAFSLSSTACVTRQTYFFLCFLR